MTEEEIKTFTQEQVNQIVENRLMSERDKFKEITAENETLKNKITAIDTENLIKEAGLPTEWTQKLTGKNQEEIKAEIQVIKALV